MNSKNRVTLLTEVLFVAFIIPITTFFLYSMYGNDFNLSLLIGVVLSVLVSMCILALRTK